VIAFGKGPCDEAVVHSAGEALVCDAATRRWVLAATILGSSRLSARRLGLEHQDPEPLRSPVHRGREAGRPRPDDENVAEERLIDRGVEAETVRNLQVGRVAKHHVPTTDGHRHVALRDAELVEQVLHP
jgi:hypothetical protein